MELFIFIYDTAMINSVVRQIMTIVETTLWYTVKRGCSDKTAKSALFCYFLYCC